MNRKPNVIVIIADSLRQDALGCYGNPYAKTPNLDTLAENGLQFANCFSTSPLCVPARSQLLSGMYCHETGNLQNPSWQYFTDQPVEVDGVYLEGTIETLPQILARHDYYTAHLGKNHFYPRHNTMGFHHLEQCDFYGRHLYTMDDYYLFLKENDCEHLFLDAFGRVEGNSGGQGLIREEFGLPDRICPYVSKIPIEMHHTPWLGKRCEEFIRETPEDMPFFAVFSFYAPHDPYSISPPYDTLIDWQSIQLPEVNEQPEPSTEYVGEQSLRRQVDPETWKKNISHYHANISLIDKQVGKIVKALQETGRYQDTLLIVTADHGETLGEHGIWGKNIMYDCCTRVPLIVHHGGGETATGVTRQTATWLDLFPTILDQAKARIPQHQRIQGQVLDLKTVQSGDDNRIIIGELANSPYPQFFVQQGPWKLIHIAGRNESELYDLSQDPHELNNLVSQRPEKRDHLLKILENWRAEEAPHWREKVPNISIDWQHELMLSHL